MATGQEGSPSAFVCLEMAVVRCEWRVVERVVKLAQRVVERVVRRGELEIVARDKVKEHEEEIDSWDTTMESSDSCLTSARAQSRRTHRTDGAA